MVPGGVEAAEVAGGVWWEARACGIIVADEEHEERHIQGYVLGRERCQSKLGSTEAAPRMAEPGR